MSDQSRQFAKELHDRKYVYHGYGLLDGISLSYSTYKYVYADWLYHGREDATLLMHDWMITPVGFITVVLGMGILTTLSYFANIVDDDERDKYKNYTVRPMRVLRNDEKPEQTDFDAPETLYVYLKNDQLHCETKDKDGLRDTFTLPNDIDVEFSNNQLQLDENKKLLLLNKTSMRGYAQIRYVIVTRFPFLRDTLKALKNVYKALNSMLAISELFLVSTDLRLWILPASLILSVLLVPIRLWLRGVAEAHKAGMSANKNLLQALENETNATSRYSPENPQVFYDYASGVGSKRYLNQWALRNANHDNVPIYYEGEEDRSNALVWSGVAGLIDGLYLYMGLAGLANLLSLSALSVLGVSALPIVLALSIIFVVMNVVVRIFERYEYQRALFATQDKIVLAILGKDLNRLVGQAREETNRERLEGLFEQITSSLTAIERMRDQLSSDTNCSTFQMALLYGVRNGLYAYSAIASVLFGVATLCLITSGLTNLPAILVCGAIILGAIVSIAVTIDTFGRYYFPTPSTEVECGLEHRSAESARVEPIVPLAPKLYVYLDENKHVMCAVRIDGCLKKEISIEQMLGGERKEVKAALMRLNEPLPSKVLARIFNATSKYGYVSNKWQNLCDTLKLPASQRSASINDLLPLQLETAILSGLITDASMQCFYQEWFEVIRAAFSGIKQGQKSTEFLLALIGCYNDQYVIRGVAGVVCFLYAMGLGLRSLAKFIGKTYEEDPEDAPILDGLVVEEEPQLEPQPQLVQAQTLRPSTPPPASPSFLSRFSLFSYCCPLTQGSGLQPTLGLV